MRRAGCSGGSDDDPSADALTASETTPLVTETVAPADVPTSTVAPDDPITLAGTAEVCPAGELPSVGAFDLDTGAVLWSGCSAVTAYREVFGAADGVVVLLESSREGESAVSFDAADGTFASSRKSSRPVPAQRCPKRSWYSTLVLLLTRSSPSRWT